MRSCGDRAQRVARLCPSSSNFVVDIFPRTQTTDAYWTMGALYIPNSLMFKLRSPIYRLSRAAALAILTLFGDTWFAWELKESFLTNSIPRYINLSTHSRLWSFIWYSTPLSTAELRVKTMTLVLSVLILSAYRSTQPRYQLLLACCFYRRLIWLALKEQHRSRIAICWQQYILGPYFIPNFINCVFKNYFTHTWQFCNF